MQSRDQQLREVKEVSLVLLGASGGGVLVCAVACGQGLMQALPSALGPRTTTPPLPALLPKMPHSPPKASGLNHRLYHVLVSGI